MKDHREAFVVAILRHHLGLWAEVLKVMCRRGCHVLIISLSKSLRNRLSAGYSVITLMKPAENKAYARI